LGVFFVVSLILDLIVVFIIPTLYYGLSIRVFAIKLCNKVYDVKSILFMIMMVSWVLATVFILGVPTTPDTYRQGLLAIANTLVIVLTLNSVYYPPGIDELQRFCEVLEERYRSSS